MIDTSGAYTFGYREGRYPPKDHGGYSCSDPHEMAAYRMGYEDGAGDRKAAQAICSLTGGNHKWTKRPPTEMNIEFFTCECGKWRFDEDESSRPKSNR